LLKRDLNRVFGSLTESVLDKLQKPPRRMYFRVNTLRVTPGVLLDKLRDKYPGYRFGLDPLIPEALYVEVKGPFKLPGDVSASKKYYRPDLIEPEVEMASDGSIQAPMVPGLGARVREDVLEMRRVRMWDSAENA